MTARTLDAPFLLFGFPRILRSEPHGNNRHGPPGCPLPLKDSQPFVEKEPGKVRRECACRPQAEATAHSAQVRQAPRH
jgi:hypothetical protein